jgi:hypothetical protein
MERGFLDAAGEPVPATKVYFVAVNSARLALVRLAERVGSLDVGGALADLEREGQAMIRERRLRAVE